MPMIPDPIATTARSFLFVPGSVPERHAKALGSGADCVVFDLEDAVAPDMKAFSREYVRHRLTECTDVQLRRSVVRINAAHAEWHEADVEMVRDWVSRGVAVMLPKVECAMEVQRVASKLGPEGRLLPLIESLAGLDAVGEIVTHRQVLRLAFGHLDFQLDLGIPGSPDGMELAAARYALVAASRRARKAPPVDGITVDIGDRERLAVDASRSKASGFGGKLCIHPSQIATVHSIFSPTDREIAWARRVIEAAGKHETAAFSLDGRMVDRPVVLAAEATLKMAAVGADCVCT